MSTVDDAIQAHMTHGACAGADPQTDSLGEQTQPRLREGWEDEAADPPHNWALYAIAALLSFALAHCTRGWSGL